MVFSRQSFLRARFQKILVILFVPYEISQTIIILFLLPMQTREQARPCLSDTANLRRSAETPGGAAETIEKSKLDSSYEADEKFAARKMN